MCFCFALSLPTGTSSSKATSVTDAGAGDVDSVRDCLRRLTTSLHVLRERYLAEAHRAQEAGKKAGHKGECALLCRQLCVGLWGAGCLPPSYKRVSIPPPPRPRPPPPAPRPPPPLQPLHPCCSRRSWVRFIDWPGRGCGVWLWHWPRVVKCRGAGIAQQRVHGVPDDDSAGGHPTGRHARCCWRPIPRTAAPRGALESACAPKRWPLLGWCRRRWRGCWGRGWGRG